MERAWIPRWQAISTIPQRCAECMSESLWCTSLNTAVPGGASERGLAWCSSIAHEPPEWRRLQCSSEERRDPLAVLHMFALLGSSALPTSVRGFRSGLRKPLYVRCAAGRPARASLSPLASDPSSLLRPAARRIKRFLEAGISMETTAVLEYLAGADERSDTATLYITSAAASEAAHAVSAEHAGELDGQFFRSGHTASKHTRLDHQRQTGRTSVMATTAAAGLPRAARTPSLRLTQVAIDQLPSFVSKSEVDQQPAHQSEGAIENWRIEVAQELEREKTKRVSVGESVAQAVQDVSELFLRSRESTVYLGSSSFWPSN